MRQPPAKPRRPRTPGRRPSGRQTFDSNGPGVRIRGTASQVVEKYTALARDASSNGDRVLAENMLQHAEHYQRLSTPESGGEQAARRHDEAGQGAQDGNVAQNGGQNGGGFGRGRPRRAPNGQQDHHRAGHRDGGGEERAIPPQAVPPGAGPQPDLP